MKYKVGDIVVGTRGMIFKIKISKVVNGKYGYSHKLTSKSDCNKSRPIFVSSLYLDECSELDKQYTRKQKLIKLNGTTTVVK